MATPMRCSFFTLTMLLAALVVTLNTEPTSARAAEAMSTATGSAVLPSPTSTAAATVTGSPSPTAAGTATPSPTAEQTAARSATGTASPLLTATVGTPMATTTATASTPTVTTGSSPGNSSTPSPTVTGSSSLTPVAPQPATASPTSVATEATTATPATPSVVATPEPAPVSASVASLTLSVATYSHVAQSQTGVLVLTADDSAGFGDGWNVAIQTSSFIYSGDNSGADIPAANLSLTSTNTPVMTAGQPVDVTNGPKVPSTSPVGTLDIARKVVQTNPNYGRGSYIQRLGVSFTIPAMARAGVYTGTLTTSISSAP